MQCLRCIYQYIISFVALIRNVYINALKCILQCNLIITIKLKCALTDIILLHKADTLSLLDSKCFLHKK